MHTFKDFITRLSTDEAFANEINTAAAEKRAAGAKNAYEVLIPVAKERGYEITEQELKEYMNSQVTELSEEEMGKVSGGVSCAILAALGASAAVISSVVATVLQTNKDDKDKKAIEKKRVKGV